MIYETHDLPICQARNGPFLKFGEKKYAGRTPRTDSATSARWLLPSRRRGKRRPNDSAFDPRHGLTHSPLNQTKGNPHEDPESAGPVRIGRTSHHHRFACPGLPEGGSQDARCVRQHVPRRNDGLQICVRRRQFVALGVLRLQGPYSATMLAIAASAVWIRHYVHISRGFYPRGFRVKCNFDPAPR